MYSFIIHAGERNLFLRADSKKNMEKWFRAIEMQADYARGGDGTSMMCNPSVASVPKKRIRQSHSLIDELDKATKALTDLEQRAYDPDEVVNDEYLETSTGTESAEVVFSLGDEPSPPQGTRVQIISKRNFNPDLAESFEDSYESIDHDIPIRVQKPAAGSGISRATPSSNPPSRSTNKYEDFDEDPGSRSNSIRNPSPRGQTRTGWM
jgi:hypothetical protein